MSTAIWFTSGVIVVVAGVDVWLKVREGGKATISWQTRLAASKYPIIGVAVGIVIGHIFWSQ